MVGEQSHNGGVSSSRGKARPQPAASSAGNDSWSGSTEPEAKSPQSDPTTEEYLERTEAPAAGRERSLPKTFGEYVILDRIGVGGMGRVFKAKHKRMQRVVALKQLPVAAAESSRAARRFQREVHALAKLEHPNIVTAYDAGEVDGVLYLVMQYVDGENLKSLVHRNGPCRVAQAVDYVLQAASGLGFAHSQGVIHRDIKPSNLIADKTGTVKILDLGLARFEAFSAEDGVSSDTLTLEGQQLGTADYMAPEQFEDAHRADHRSDVYALGCTLHYLLVGKPPYSSEFPAAVLLAHCDAPIPSLRTERTDVPEALDAVFQKMLAKEPELRCQSMADVISALESTGLAREPSCFPVAGRLSGSRKEEQVGMAPPRDLLGIERQGDTVVLTWTTELEGLDYEQIEDEMERVLDVLDSADIKHVIIDCRLTGYCPAAALRYSSAAIGFYVKLWARVESIGGSMAMCGVSDPGARIIHDNKLHTLWPICDSLQEAWEAIRGR